MRRFEVVGDGTSKFWEIECVGAEVRMRWGRIGTKGQTKTKTLDSPTSAQAEHDVSITRKLKKGYREVGSGSATSTSGGAATARNPEVTVLLDEIAGLGAEVSIGQPVGANEISAAETLLGFALPAEYREFVQQFDGIRIELERTWFFYGLAEALAKTVEYSAEFRDALVTEGRRESDGASGPYYPRQFVVLMDEGDFSNAASGTVYDAELGAMLDTAGLRWVDREDAYEIGYWGALLDALSEVRDRIADSDDVLVVGGERDRARKRHAHAEGAADRPTGDSVLAAAVEQLYQVFAPHPRLDLLRQCFMGAECTKCARYAAILAQTPLRDLTAKQLEHFAYFGIPSKAPDDVTDEDRTHYADYLHFLPRILEVLDELSMMGNPSVVIGQIFKYLRTLLPLSEDEWAAVHRYFDALWGWVLLNPPDLNDLNESAVHNYLAPFVRTGRPITPFLETWFGLLPSRAASLHAAKFLEDYKFEQTAEYYGWHGLDAPFAELKAWLLREDLAEALERAAATAPAKERHVYVEAFENIRRELEYPTEA